MAKEAYVWDGEELKLNLSRDEILLLLKSDKRINPYLFDKRKHKVGPIEFKHFEITRNPGQKDLEYFSSMISVNGLTDNVIKHIDFLYTSQEDFLKYVLFKLNKNKMYGKALDDWFGYGIDLGNSRILSVLPNGMDFIGNVYRFGKDINTEKAELIEDELMLAGRVTGLMFNIFKNIYNDGMEIPLIGEVEYADFKEIPVAEFYRDKRVSEWYRLFIKKEDELARVVARRLNDDSDHARISN